MKTLANILVHNLAKLDCDVRSRKAKNVEESLSNFFYNPDADNSFIDKAVSVINTRNNWRINPKL